MQRVYIINIDLIPVPHTSLVMAAPMEWGRPFLPCSLFFLFSFLFSSPNLSRLRLDVYYTSIHDVALMRT